MYLCSIAISGFLGSIWSPRVNFLHINIPNFLSKNELSQQVPGVLYDYAIIFTYIIMGQLKNTGHISSI